MSKVEAYCNTSLKRLSDRSVIASDRRERGNLDNIVIASVVLLPRNDKKEVYGSKLFSLHNARYDSRDTRYEYGFLHVRATSDKIINKFS